MRPDEKRKVVHGASHRYGTLAEEHGIQFFQGGWNHRNRGYGGVSSNMPLYECTEGSATSGFRGTLVGVAASAKKGCAAVDDRHGNRTNTSKRG